MKRTKDVVRVGGVGTGRIFQWAHLRVYPQLLAKARLVGFFDVDPARDPSERMAGNPQILCAQFQGWQLPIKERIQSFYRCRQELSVTCAGQRWRLAVADPIGSDGADLISKLRNTSASQRRDSQCHCFVW